LPSEKDTVKQDQGEIIALKAKSLIIFLTAGSIWASSWTFDCKHDEKIDPNLRQAIWNKSLVLINSIQRNEPTVLMSMLINEVRQAPDWRDEVIKAYKRFKPLVDGRDFKMYTQCHIVSDGSGKYQFNVPSNTREQFIIQAQRMSRETYICFLASEKYYFDYMISVVYSRIGNEWQVQRVHIGLVRISGMSSYGWYTEAQRLYEQGHEAMSYLDLEISRLLLRPSPFMQYPIEKEIIEVFDKFTAQVHGKIYVRFAHLPTRPKLYNFSAHFIKARMVPKVTYITTLSLENETGLRTEARAMTEAVETQFGGLGEDSNSISFTAYTDIPSDPNKTYACKEFDIKYESKPRSGPVIMAQNEK